MAMAMAARISVHPPACAPWRGVSEFQTGAKLVSALAPVSSSSCSRFERVQVVGKLTFGRGLAKGAYLHTSPAVNGKPVIVVTSAKHFPIDEQLIESERHCVYLIEKALMQLPPGCETFLGIFDLRGFKQKNGDLKSTKFLIDLFFKYYPKRLGQVLFVDALFVFQPGWSMIKPWVEKYAALIRFCSVDDLQNDYFTPDTIPKSFKE